MAEIALRDYITEIDSLIEGNAYDEAVAHCRHILGRYSKYLEAYRLLGKAALEKEDDRAAADLFQRVLSVDPEDFVARVGLSIVYDRQGALDDALWQMERGFELMPSNDVIQSELRRLYGRRDGVEPERISLTRGALARMYAQGDLYDEAIAELRALVKDSPERVDLQVLLAETLWRDEQRNEAASIAEHVLNRLPYCLSANLILGEIWLNSGFSEDGEMLLRRAQAIDPDNSRANTLFGSASPLSEQTVTIARFEYQSKFAPASEPAADQVPDWLAGLAGLTLDQPESATLHGLPTPASPPATELRSPAETDLPDWLSGVEQATAETAAPAAEDAPDWMNTLWQQAETPTLDSTTPVEWADSAAPTAESEAAPDWLSQIAEPEDVSEPAAKTPSTDWLTQIQEPPAPAEIEQAAELPDWLSDLGSAPPQVEELSSDLPQADMPDWLQALRPPATEPLPPSVELPAVEESEMPEWMMDVAPAPATDAAFDFLQRLGESAQIEEPEVAAPPPPAPAESTPVPSTDDALAFLQGLSAGKDEELRAQAEQEAQARMSDIMGLKPVETAPTTPLPAPEPKPAAPPMPAESDAMPSADDALAFLQSLTVGKEDQLRQEAQRAGEERMESIMGGKPGTSPLRPPGEKAAPTSPPTPTPEPTPATPPSPATPPTDQLLSPDDALAFLQSLTVGKEEQLRQEAQRAGEERMESIMGGKPGTSPLRPQADRAAPPPPPPPSPEPKPAPVATPPPLPADDMLTAEQDALAFLSNLAAPSDLDTVEIAIESQPKPAVPEPRAAHVVEEEEIEALAATTQSPSDFWLQTADDDGGEPLSADYFERAVHPTPTPPQPKAPPKKAETPARPVEPLAAPAMPAVPPPPPIGAGEFQSRLEADPGDHEARLGLARVWWASGDREQSLRLYQQLVEDETFLSEVVGDLQRDLETFEHPDWYRILGDAHMKHGNLAQALDAYRQALTHL